MISLEKYKVILWDFDGVILDSMPIRELGFRKVLHSYPDDKVESLIHFHYQNGGWSRYVKFRYFFEEIIGVEVGEDLINDLAQEFSTIMLELLSSKELLIDETVNFIKSKISSKEMHVVSGSDQRELRILCQQLGIKSLFKSINGSPTSKPELVWQLMRDLPFDASEIVLIGDSFNDLDAASQNGIDFFGYNNIELQRGNYIPSFIL